MIAYVLALIVSIGIAVVVGDDLGKRLGRKLWP